MRFWTPSVAPVDEFRGDEQSSDEAELGMAVLASAVGVSAELPVVRRP